MIYLHGPPTPSSTLLSKWQLWEADLTVHSPASHPSVAPSQGHLHWSTSHPVPPFTMNDLGNLGCFRSLHFLSVVLFSTEPLTLWFVQIPAHLQGSAPESSCLLWSSSPFTHLPSPNWPSSCCPPLKSYQNLCHTLLQSYLACSYPSIRSLKAGTVLIHSFIVQIIHKCFLCKRIH